MVLLFDRSEEVRAALQECFVARCERNSSYSLRRYAQVLGIGYSDLSKLLRGKRKITQKMYARLAEKLPLPSHAHSSYEALDQDKFRVVADWYHFAILALARTQAFRSDSGWIARQLGISRAETNAAIERLERLHLLKKGRSGWTVSKNTTTMTSTATSPALRSLQTQLLQKAVAAIEEVDISERDHASMIMAIDPARMPEAVRRIDAFRRELCAFLEGGVNRTEVYCFS